MSYKSSARSVCDLKAHLVLVTKYRRKVISPAMLERLAQLMQHICQKWGCQCIEFNGGSRPRTPAILLLPADATIQVHQ